MLTSAGCLRRLVWEMRAVLVWLHFSLLKDVDRQRSRCIYVQDSALYFYRQNEGVREKEFDERAVPVSIAGLSNIRWRIVVSHQKKAPLKKRLFKAV